MRAMQKQFDILFSGGFCAGFFRWQKGKYYQKWHFDLCAAAFAAPSDAANKSREPTGQRLDATFKLLPANKDSHVDTHPHLGAPD